MLIDFIFDPACPWCYIGKRRLQRALALRPHMEAEISWRPFLLNPEIPPEGIDRTAYLIKKFGSETRLGRVYGAVGEAGLSEEINFDFDNIRLTPNTVDAHRLVCLAGRSGKAEDMVEALFNGYFVNAQDIGDPGVLVKIGESIGLGRRKLRAYLKSNEDTDFIFKENALVHRLGISGVPSFVFSGDMIISGAQEPRVLARMLDAAQAAENAA